MVKKIISILCLSCIIILAILPSYSMGVNLNEINKVSVDRAPRFSFDRTNENKLIIKLIENGSIFAVRLEVYDNTITSANGTTILDTSNKLASAGISISQDKKTITINSSKYLSKDKYTKFRLIAYDANSKSINSLYAYFRVKKLDKKTDAYGWYRINNSPRLSYAYENQKIKIIGVDLDKIKSIVIKDLNNGNKEILNKEIVKEKSSQEMSVYVNLASLKAVTKAGMERYKISILVTDHLNMKRREQIVLTPLSSKSYSINLWKSAGFPYNTKGISCPRYYQGDSRWANISYAGGNVANSGCGPCALAIIASGLKQKVILPSEVVSFFNANGLATRGGSYSYEATRRFAQKYDFTYSILFQRDKAKINQALDSGKILTFVIFSTQANRSIYPGKGHFIVCTGREGDKYYVTESSHFYQQDKAYTFDQVFAFDASAIYIFGNKY